MPFKLTKHHLRLNTVTMFVEELHGQCVIVKMYPELKLQKIWVLSLVLVHQSCILRFDLCVIHLTIVSHGWCHGTPLDLVPGVCLWFCVHRVSMCPRGLLPVEEIRQSNVRACYILNFLPFLQSS